MHWKKKASKINEILKKEMPEVAIPLNHTNAHELLFATILSAQCTDARVNMVTPALFVKYPTVKDFAQADPEELKALIKSTGFYNNKAKSIIGAAQKIVKDYGGQVPDSMEELTKLPGVARKTANVVLWQWFHKNEGIAVDTHVKRLAQKYGLTEHDDPVKIEQDLMQLIPQEDWGSFGLRLILHGRTCCTARGSKPDCILAQFYS